MRVEYCRDGLVEEAHEIRVVSLSDAVFYKEPYFLRSCAKPLQATLLIDYGIELQEDELALCSSSHAGETIHINIAKNILNKFNIDENLLKCGSHAPLSRSMQDSMLLKGEKYSAIHNNCSGKHIGFLLICQKMGWDMKTYDDINHPLQKAIKEKINTMCEVKEDFPMTTDGCGVPILSMPLYNLILGFKNLSKNYPQIINAIMKNPYIFGGENRLDTEIIEHSENVIAKVGAGGLCVVYNVLKKDGFAVKVVDCSMEARRYAVFEILNKLGWSNYILDKSIKTLQGKTVGYINIKD